MHREGGIEVGNGVRLVSCTLSELSNCCCLYDCREEKQTSSRRRKTGGKPSSLEPADMLAELSAKKILLNRQPTLIDRLIFQNRSALMAPKSKKKNENNKGAKRKSDVKNQPQAKKIKTDIKDQKNKKDQEKKPKPPENQKNDKETRVTRKNTTKAKIHLRSGCTMVDILKKKRNGLKNFTQLGRKKKTDTNSNVFNDKTQKNEKQTDGQERRVLKRRRRKKCSMWHTIKQRKKPKKEKENNEEEIKQEIETPEIPLEIDLKNQEIIEPENKLEEQKLEIQEISEEIKTEETGEIKQNTELIIPQTSIEIQKIEDTEIKVETPKDEPQKEIIEPPVETPPKMPDADSTSDVSHLNDSAPELNQSVPNTQNTPELPDSTKTSIEKEDKDLDVDEKEDKDIDVDEKEDKDMDVDENDEVNNIDEKLLAQVQTQLEEEESLRQSLKLAQIAQDDDEKQDKDIISHIENDEKPKEEVKQIEMTTEQKQMKESVLQALGLKSLESEDKPLKRSDGYTGTLKAVIKLNRFGDKKQMIYKRAENNSPNNLEYKICSEPISQEDQEVRNINQNKNGASHIYSSLPNSPVDSDGKEDKGISEKESLIIPEKSSSFSIHPGRLCSDVCTYCFGKFGSLDTPCHVAQLKGGEERQKKILQNEPHLTGESCLCDACYRYVDRKANCPSKPLQGNGTSVKSRLTLSACCVTGCNEQATRTMKRKWLIKLKKCINHKLEIDTDKPGHGIFYSLCTQHHNWVEYLTVCGICRRRLNRNNLFSLGLETDRLNLMLAEDGIPARLSDNLFLCKLCRYYSDLRLKYTDTEAIPPDKKAFYRDYRRKILLSLDIALSESDDDSVDVQRTKDDGNKNGEAETDDKNKDEVMSLHGLATLLGDQPQQQARIQVKFGNVNIGTLSNLNIGQQGNSSSSKPSRSESDRPHSPALRAQLEYQGSSSPDGFWERYTSTIMFDKNTKQLWTELQRPYGNQSSFLRHLVMLEKIWRAGYLSLTPDADERAVKYLTSAKNRIHAFDGVPTPSKEIEKPKEEVKPPTPPPPPPPPSQPVPQPQPYLPVPQPQLPKASQPQPPSKPSYPIFSSSGEIEVTEVKNDVPKPAPKVVSAQQARTQRPSIHQKQQNPISQMHVTMMQQMHQQPMTSQQQMSSNQMTEYREMYRQQAQTKKKITPLDRAKSLVRMAPPMHQQYYRMQQQQRLHQQRLQQQQMGMKFNSGTQPPPLLKLGLHNRPILPKLPKALTVVSMPATSQPSSSHTTPPAITLRHSGITIEKQTAPARHHLPIEKPSISVFREPSSH